MSCIGCFCCTQQDQSISPNIEKTEKSKVQSDEKYGFAEASSSVDLRKKNRFNQHLMPSNGDSGHEETNCDEKNKRTESENLKAENALCLPLSSSICSCSSAPDVSNALVIPRNSLQLFDRQGYPQHTVLNVENLEIHNPQAEAIVLGNECSVNMRKDEVDTMRKQTEKLLQIYVGDDMLYMKKSIEVILEKLQEMEQRNKHREENGEAEEPKKVWRRSIPTRKTTAKTGGTMSWPQNSTTQKASVNSYCVSSLQNNPVMSAVIDKQSVSRSLEAKVAREHHDTRGDDTQQVAPTAYPQVTQVVSLPADSHETEHQSFKDKDLSIIHRYGSKRKSKRKLSFKKISKTHELLQSMQWEQYEVIQKFVVRHVTIELQECQSTDELREKANNFKERLQTIIDEKTSELIRAFSRSSVAKKREQNPEYQENAKSSLYEYRDEVIQDANDQMEKIEDEQIQKLHLPGQNITKRNENISDKEAAQDAAELFISLITEKIEKYVLTLLPLAVQHKIVYLTFSCQKSYVIKKIMKEIISGYFTESMKYILDPNGFAANWLKNYTNKTIFKRKSGIHFYAKVAKKEIEQIFEEIERSIKLIKQRTENENICNWLKEFISHIQKSEVLPVLEADLENVKQNINLDLKRFLSFVNKRLDFMKDGILQKFKNTTEKTVNWADDPYKKIMKKLWGCTYCCPFCHEPCFFTDKAHVKHGQPHRCIQHRPLGVYGFMTISDSKLITDWCGQLFQNTDLGYKFKDSETLRPCKEYKDEFPDWMIEECDAQSEMNPPTFWIWFICAYISSLQEVYGANSPELPDKWKKITDEDAVSSLDFVYICR